jgi:amidase
MHTELWQWSAVDLAHAIRSETISSREALESCLSRLAAVNPALNAVVDLIDDEARSAADRADAAVRAGETTGPLHGVPLTVKINVDYAGRATTNGVKAFENMIAQEDSVPVANLRKAGAIIFGRTNVPGFSTRYFTDNDLHGRTLNPWDPGRTPGGSSGGAAVAVAAGIGPIGHGNDRAGSVRYPAHCCGVYGLRASVGRVADFNASSVEERGLMSQLTHIQGPLARSIGDIRLTLEALSQGDPRDPWWVPALADPGPVDRPKTAAIFATSPDADVHPDVENAVRIAGKWLEQAGYAVEEVAPPHLTEAGDMFWTMLMAEERATSENEKSASTKGIEMFGDQAVQNARASTRVYAGDLDYEGYINGLRRRTSILREWQLFFQRHSVLVMPVSWQPAFPIDHDQRGDETMRRMLDSFHPMLAISTLGLTGLAAPTGPVNCIPMGVQIVGPRFGEELCLRAGEVLEANYAPMPIDPIADPR